MTGAGNEVVTSTSHLPKMKLVVVVLLSWCVDLLNWSWPKEEVESWLETGQTLFWRAVDSSS